MTLQTDMLMWNQFPWACDNVRYDLEMTDLNGFFTPGESPECDDGNEVAFWCAYPHRILTSECRGMDCPYCKIHGHKEFIDNLKGIE